MATIGKKLSTSTEARTAPSIGIWLYKSASKRTRIGAIQEYAVSQNRNNTRRMELDSDPPGRTIEMVPGPVTDFTLTIKRAMLNTVAMFEAFGVTTTEDLVGQTDPLEIEEVRAIPGSSTATQTVNYKSCFAKSIGLSVDIKNEWVLVQDMVLDVGYSDFTDASAAGATGA